MCIYTECNRTEKKEKDMAPKITIDELRERIDGNPELVLVEALPEQYYRHSHLPGAINIPHDSVDELAGALLPDKHAEIVVYCASGPCRNSGIAANRLVALGYTQVADYHEGKAEWVEAGLPVEGQSRARAA
jgi:rhodanese-related sulfurtransferase